MCHQDPDVAGSFGFEDVKSVAHPLPDEGEALNFGSTTLHFIPAHFLHSPGHLVVEDIEKHIRAMKPVHERLMASNKAIKA